VIGWWTGLPWWLRAGVALVFILVSTFLWFGCRYFWPYGWAVGAVLLLLSFPSRPEKKGYHDF
jgi:hypothetical protein